MGEVSRSGVRPASGAISVVESTARRADIQGLRALAVLAVVAYHAGLPVPGGFVGVDVFFVISGFVITAMLAREHADTGRIRFGRFYLRRFKRLTPALALMIAVTVLVSVLVLSPLGTQQTAAKTALGAILLVANFVIAKTTGGYFDAPAETNPLLHTWSLSVEEQFYLVFPAILAGGWLLARAARARWLPVLVVAAAGAASLALCLAGALGVEIPGVHPKLLGFYSPFTRAWEFAAGALLALIPLRRVLPIRWATGIAVAGAALLAGSLWLIDGSGTYPGPWTLLPVAGTVLLILAGERSDNPFSRALSAKPMVKTGDWSYSIYLWHWPFIVFAGLIWPGNSAALLAAAALSFAPAIASYQRIEQPIRAMTIGSWPRLAGVVTATLIPPLGLAMGLWFGSQHGFGIPQVQEYQAAVFPAHADNQAGCDTTTPQGERSDGACVWNSDAGGAPIYLIGDSHAGHLSEAVISAGERLRRPVTISTTNGCPFTGTYVESPAATTAWNDQCNLYGTGTHEWLLAQEPGTVVLASISASISGESAVSFGSSPDDATSEPAAKTQLMQDGLTDVADEWIAAGHQVVLVQDTPFVDWRPSLCSSIDIVRGSCVEAVSMPEAVSAKQVHRDMLQRVAGGTGEDVLDLIPPLCPEGECSSYIDGTVMYRDTNHLSVPGSASLGAVVAEAITEAD